MVRKALALGLALILVSVALTAWGQEKSPSRIVSEKFIGKFHASGIPESIKISPNCKRVAYVVGQGGWFGGGKQFVVVDGKDEKPYDKIGATGIVFSPDNRRVAYLAQEGDKWFVVVDGKEQKQYDRFIKDSLVFSPDSQSLAYAAEVSNKNFVVVDGKEEKQYDGIMQGTLTFSPDSKRVAYSANEGNKYWFVVVDGNEGKKYDSLLRGGNKVIFDSLDAFHYLAEIGLDRIYLVEERIE